MSGFHSEDCVLQDLRWGDSPHVSELTGKHSVWKKPVTKCADLQKHKRIQHIQQGALICHSLESAYEKSWGEKVKSGKQTSTQTKTWALWGIWIFPKRQLIIKSL